MNLLRLAKGLFFLSFIAFYSNLSLAQAPVLVKIPNLDEVIKAEIPANTASSQKVIFYHVIKGNVTSQIGVELQGPKGLEAVIEAAQVKGSTAATLDKGSFWQPDLKGTLIKGARKSATTAALVVSSPVNNVTTRSGNSLCSILPRNVIEAIIQNLSQQLGRPVSYQEYCSGALDNAGSVGDDSLDTEDGVVPAADSDTTQPVSSRVEEEYLSATGYLQKDNCSAVKDYLLKVTVSLSKVSAADLAQGFEVLSRIRESEYTGRRPASLKPVSDGKYAPRPLLLMQSLGGKQEVGMVKWTNGKPKLITKVAATPSLAYYRGYVLIRIIADKLLAGGRGEKVNFELTNGSAIYNVCGKRARVRWRVNGYPGGD